MEQNESRTIVREIMAEFAARTGLTSTGRAPRRYLWTDAFAVCNFLELFRQTGEEGYRDLALHLVDQVHGILGRHRDDDPRTGWISGLDEEEGRRHPTTGGLRIGKKLNERQAGEPFDEGLEWDRDGQYYHYLTKWMHALNRVSRITTDPTYNAWAIELAQTAHAAFTYVPSSGGRKRMCWRMSVDLTYPLVPSMGQHDPLDGLVTYSQLQATALVDFPQSSLPDLSAEIAELAGICREKSWVTDDPLGIGGLLFDACRVAQLMIMGAFEQADLLATLLESSLAGLESFAGGNTLKLPADYRLAFRELGLVIGLKAVEMVGGLVAGNPGVFEQKNAVDQRIKTLMRYAPLGEMLERFWLESTNREAGSWLAHREINMVMLATSRAPEGFLMI